MLIINADDDCLFNLEHGEDLSRRIPGSTLALIEGAGHALSAAVAPVLAGLVVPHLEAAETRVGG